MGRLETPLAVVGCGHSATFFIAEMFQHLGIDVRHELVGSDGVAGWNFTHLLRGQFPEFGLPRETIVLHQVRHPLKVISSVQSMLDSTWTDMKDRVLYRGYHWNPMDDEHPVRGMRYYLAWNYFAESIADYRYRVEDIESALPVILKMIGVPKAPMPKVPPRLNKHQYEHTFTWSELYEADRRLCKLVKEMSVEYGYKD